MRMLRWARGKIRLDSIRNEDIGKEAHIKPVETILENKRLKWFGHCLRRKHNHIMCEIFTTRSFWEKQQWGRPKKRWRDNIQGDMKKYQLTEDMAQDRKYWMTKIMAGSAQTDGQETWETLTYLYLRESVQTDVNSSFPRRSIPFIPCLLLFLFLYWGLVLNSYFLLSFLHTVFLLNNTLFVVPIAILCVINVTVWRVIVIRRWTRRLGWAVW